MSPLALFVVLSLTAVLQAQNAPTPGARFNRVMANPHLHKSKGQITGEQFCWHAAWAADDFIDAYLAWGDANWLAGALWSASIENTLLNCADLFCQCIHKEER